MQPTVEFNPPMLNGVSASKVFLPASPDAPLTVLLIYAGNLRISQQMNGGPFQRGTGL